MDLQDKTIEELEAEIERRKKATKPTTPKPMSVERQDWSRVVTMVMDYFNAECKGEYIDDDLEGYIFEAAIEAVYGDTVWQYLKNCSG